MKSWRLVFVGVGGQGNLLASRLLGEAALSVGIPAVVSEIHGMAQRGGIVESAVLLGDITSPIVSNGEADVLIGFEPVETLRALNKCNINTLIITNTCPLPPFTVSIGQGVYPPLNDVLHLVQKKLKRVIALDGKLSWRLCLSRAAMLFRFVHQQGMRATFVDFRSLRSRDRREHVHCSQ